jgi:hypothetical protein
MTWTCSLCNKPFIIGYRDNDAVVDDTFYCFDCFQEKKDEFIAEMQAQFEEHIEWITDDMIGTCSLCRMSFSIGYRDNDAVVDDTFYCFDCFREKEDEFVDEMQTQFEEHIEPIEEEGED